MAATALVQAKVEPELKSEVEKYFAEFGMDTSTAIRMFLKKVKQTRSIPFHVGIEEDEDECSYEPTEKFAKFLDKTTEDIKHGRNILRFNSNEEAFAHLEKLMNK